MLYYYTKARESDVIIILFHTGTQPHKQRALAWSVRENIW